MACTATLTDAAAGRVNSVGELAQLLGLALSPGPHMRQATEKLRMGESHGGFGIALLQLLQNEAADPPVRQAASIYFKNYIRRSWSVEQGAVSTEDRNLIKSNLLQLAIQAARPVQIQLLAVIEEISSTDFPSDWQCLLPGIIQQLQSSQDPRIWNSAMEVAHSAFLRFRTCTCSTEMFHDVQLCTKLFGAPHLQAFKITSERILRGGLSLEHMKPHLEFLQNALLVFHDLSIKVLPDFFKDHCEAYFQVFIAMMTWSGLNSEELVQDVWEIKGLACKNMTLYVDRHDELMAPFVSHCVKAVWELLVTLGDQSDQSDHLVSCGMEFLSSAAATDWPASPFKDPAVLRAICERVVLPSIQLRPGEVALFSEDPKDFISRDLDGVANEVRRRQKALDLVKMLRRKQDAEVTEVIISYVGRMLDHARSASSEMADLYKDASIHLIMSLANSIEKTEVVIQFFQTLIVPELQAEPLFSRPVVRAACLKFIMVFKQQLPADQIMGVLPAISKHILADSPVLHTYAAACVAALSTVQDRTPEGRKKRYDAAVLHPVLCHTIQPAFQILASGSGIPQNEHLMKAMVTIMAFLGPGVREVALSALQQLAQIFGSCVAAANNAEFVHNSFDAAAALIHILLPAQEDAVECMLFPVFGRIWQEDPGELLPYCLQVLGLMLDLSTNLRPVYVNLFTAALARDLWRSSGNVPGLVRLLRAYFAKHQAFTGPLQNSLPTIFEHFQLVLGNKKVANYSFTLLSAIFRYLPLEMYRSYLQPAISVVLARLQAQKSPDLEKEFVISLSLFAYLQENPSVLPDALNQIQPGLFETFFTQTWLPSTSRVFIIQRRKVCIAGIIRLMNYTGISNNAESLSACCEHLTALLKWKRLNEVSLSTLLSWWMQDESDRGMGQEYEVAFNRLHGTEMDGSCSWDMLPEIKDVAAGLQAIKITLAPLQQKIAQLGEVAEALSNSLQ